MPDPYTIRIFVPDGDPESIRIIDRMNWTGVGIAFPRSKWPEVNRRDDIQRAGVYILVGYEDEESNIPTLYIGQADGVKNRIDSHAQNKGFWDSAIVFVSASSNLNRAHVTWLEYALIKRAKETARCVLDNAAVPQEPGLTEAEKADTQGFMNEILQVLPLVGLSAFEFPKTIAVPVSLPTNSTTLDTMVVAARESGFERVFLNEDSWHAVRISGGMLDKIKYIAAYQTQPVSAITHYAPVARIESYGELGKYKLVFSEKAKPVGPIPLGNAPSGTMQGSRYTTFTKLQAANTISDLGE
jgi:hypothetical protein